MPIDRRYRTIPGTYIQDGELTRRGYELARFLMTLNRQDGRDRFRAGEARCLADYDLTDGQREAVLGRDWLAMLRSGANVYYLLKLAAYDGVSVQHMAGSFSGVTEEEFIAMMIAGGRSPHTPEPGQPAPAQDGR